MLDPNSQEDDAVLLARFAAGDQAAARQLTDRLLPGVLRQAWRVLGDQAEAEDVAQEVMMKLWRQADTWRPGEAKVTTWLYRVTQNLCIDRIRRRRPMTDIDDVAEPADQTPSALEQMANHERNQAVSAAIAELPERQREAILLRHFEGCGNPEIAARLDCSVEAVESLLARARRQLSKMLRTRDEEIDND